MEAFLCHFEPHGARVPVLSDSHASSSHELSLGPLKRVLTDNHCIYAHFPKDRNCEICQRSNITRALCRRRFWWSRTSRRKICDLITADQKHLSDETESRNSHRYAIVVQDIATQWNQFYVCKTTTSQDTKRSWQKFLEPSRKPKFIYTDTSQEI